MSQFVLDASVSAAWIVPDPQSQYALKIRQRFEAGENALVPSLWPVEMANCLAKAVRLGILSEDNAEHGLRQIEVLLLSGPRIEIEASVPLVSTVFETARTCQISAYDGCYLELARRYGLPLATLDKGLRLAAKKAGVEVLR